MKGISRQGRFGWWHLRRVRDLLKIAGALGLLLGAAAIYAQEPDAAALEQAKRMAVGVCGTCHGGDGNNTQPKFPRLAEQNANYLAAQLRAFKAQTRGDPDAIGYMWGMSGQYNDATLEALSKYYSMQKAKPGRGGHSPLIERGREIYLHGIEAESVPACATCHGADAHGTAEFPRLAGQHAQYVLKQLASFQSNMRNIAVMHGVAQNLRLAEMEAVADYLEAQP
jgi:cytochrome c553